MEWVLVVGVALGVTASVAVDVIRTLDDLVSLVSGREDLYVRWSADPAKDQTRGTSVDQLTGVELPGLSANPLRPERWWTDRPLNIWVARRLYDYRHLQDQPGKDVRAWILAGDVVGRGPDNEPLLRCKEVVAWLDNEVIRTAAQLIEAEVEHWGSLNRT